MACEILYMSVLVMFVKLFLALRALPRGHGQRNLLTQPPADLRHALKMGVFSELVLPTVFGSNFGIILGPFWDPIWPQKAATNQDQF